MDLLRTHAARSAFGNRLEPIASMDVHTAVRTLADQAAIAASQQGEAIMMMDGSGMWFGGTGMLLAVILVILVIAALVKYLMK